MYGYDLLPAFIRRTKQEHNNTTLGGGGEWGGYRALKGGPRYLCAQDRLLTADHTGTKEWMRATQLRSPTNHGPGAPGSAKPNDGGDDKDARARRLERSQRHSLHRALPTEDVADTWLP